MKNFFTQKVLRYIPDIIKKDFVRKVVAFLLTLMIYVFVYMQINSDTLSLDTSVEIKLPRDIMLSDIKITEPRITVSGSSHRIKKIEGHQIKLVLEMDDGVISRDKKSIRFNLEPHMAQLPIGINALSFSPKTLTVAVDTLTSRKLKVIPYFSKRDKLSPDLAIGKINVVPSEITVEGPSGKLQNLKEIKTRPISLEEITSSFDCDTEPGDYPGLTFTPKQVIVQVEIIPNWVTRTFRALPIRVMSAPKYRQQFSCEIITSPTADVVVEGRKSAVSLLRYEELLPFVDVSHFTKPGQYQVDVRCGAAKDGVITKRIIPKTVTIKLEMHSK